MGTYNHPLTREDAGVRQFETAVAAYRHGEVSGGAVVVVLRCGYPNHYYVYCRRPSC